MNQHQPDQKRDDATDSPENAVPESRTLDHLDVLHKSIGNAAVGRLLRSTDAPVGAAPVQRKAASGPEATGGDQDQLLEQVRQSRSGGEALQPNTRANMEQHLGVNLGSVRVHTDSSADALSKQLNARAFTTGNDVFFRSGTYDPGSSTGLATLAHELTHVAQQSGQGTAPSRQISHPNDPAEHEASAMARRVTAVPSAPASVTAATATSAASAWGAPPAGAVQKAPEEEEMPPSTPPSVEDDEDAPVQRLVASDSVAQLESAAPDAVLQRAPDEEEEQLPSSAAPDQTSAAGQSDGSDASAGSGSTTPPGDPTAAKPLDDEEDEETVQRLPEDEEDEETVQRLAEDEEDEETVQRLPEDEEDEEALQRLPEDEEEEALQRLSEDEEDEAALQRLPEDEEDEETAVQRLPEDEEDEETAVQRLPEDEEDEAALQRLPEGEAIAIQRAPDPTGAPPAPAPAGVPIPGTNGTATVPVMVDPNGIQLTHTGAHLPFTDDAAFVRMQLEKLITTHNNGLDQLEVFENSDYSFKFSDEMGPQTPALNGPTTPGDMTPEARTEYRKKVAGVVKTEVGTLKDNLNKFRELFKDWANTTLWDLLKDSETRLEDMKKKYGIAEKSSWIFWTETSVNQSTEKNAELVKAAAPMLKKYGEVEQAEKELEETHNAHVEEGAPMGPTGVAAQAANDKFMKLKQEYTGMVEEQRAQHPILVAYKLDFDQAGAGERLKKLAAGDVADMGATAGKEIVESLGNIQKVRDKARGNRDLIWDLEKIVGITKNRGEILDNDFIKNQSLQRQVVSEVTGKRQAIDEMTTAAITAVALAVGLLTLSPGTALIGAQLAVADATLATFGAITALQKYQLESAVQGSDIDKGRAISEGEEPSLFWLALDIGGALLSLKGGIAAGRTLFKQAATLTNEAIALKAIAAGAEGAEAATASEALAKKLKQVEAAGEAAKPGDGARLVEQVQKASAPASGTAKAMSELMPQLGKLGEANAAKAEELVADAITKIGEPATVEAAGGYAKLEAKLGDTPSMKKIRAWRQNTLDQLGEFVEANASKAGDVPNPQGAIEDARKFLARAAHMSPEQVEHLLAAQVGTELMKIERMEKAAESAMSIKHLFMTTSNPRDRLKALGAIINPLLEEAGIPATVYEGFKSGRSAGMDFTKWGLDIGSQTFAQTESLINKVRLTEDEFRVLVSLAYHEARHAEQWFLMARYRLGLPGANIYAVGREMYMSATVMSEAKRVGPLVEGEAGFDLAKKWYNSVYEASGKANRAKVYSALSKTRQDATAAETALREAREVAKPPAEIGELLKVRDAAVQANREAELAYRSLPEEVDAYLAQDVFNNIMNKKLQARPAYTPNPNGLGRARPPKPE